MKVIIYGANEMANAVATELFEDYDSLISEDRKYITKDYFAAYYSGAIVGLIRQILKEPNLDIEKTKTIVLDLIAK